MVCYDYVWLQCECGREGKCIWDLPPNVAPLWDVDGVGLLCELCLDDAHPGLTVRWFRGRFPKDVAELIERLSYSEWARMPR